jgi:hypothetical protein
MERASHDPFETSKANLAYLFESNHEYLENASEDAMLAVGCHKPQTRPVLTRSEPERQSRFVDLHYEFFIARKITVNVSHTRNW